MPTVSALISKDCFESKSNHKASIRRPHRSTGYVQPSDKEYVYFLMFHVQCDTKRCSDVLKYVYNIPLFSIDIAF